MSHSIIDNTGQFRRAATMRRAGLVALALFVAVYLTAITVSLSGQLDSPRRVVLFVLLWLLGLGALALLTRAWRTQPSSR